MDFIEDDIFDGFRIEQRYDKERTEKLAYHYKEILSLLGENSEREGLL